MDRCLDSGVKRSGARQKHAQCQKEMERRIGPDYALKESQIRACILWQVPCQIVIVRMKQNYCTE